MSCHYRGRVGDGFFTAGQRPAVMKIPSLSGRRQTNRDEDKTTKTYIK
ncbi:MAG: hypothetical protein LBP59_15560 [Planctomycetaceae bacterium]|nr:hypothetical protein [Planctomycetaceae bacterium]